MLVAAVKLVLVMATHELRCSFCRMLLSLAKCHGSATREVLGVSQEEKYR